LLSLQITTNLVAESDTHLSSQNSVGQKSMWHGQFLCLWSQKDSDQGLGWPMMFSEGLAEGHL
jgi:hypothetical protein